VTPHKSHLNSDGTVFPPVTPDPPLPPGQEDIEVPDIVPVRAPDAPKTTKSTHGSEASTHDEPPTDPAPAGS
jgi:hypothetical protein